MSTTTKHAPQTPQAEPGDVKNRMAEEQRLTLLAAAGRRKGDPYLKRLIEGVEEYRGIIQQQEEEEQAAEPTK
jgi:hypothetical protein